VASTQAINELDWVIGTRGSQHPGKLGRITTGGALTEYPIAGGPVGIAVGKDGQLYLDLVLAPGVDRVNLQGQVAAHWGLPGGVGPLLIATGFGLDIW
jgi:hypothetical protein